MPKLLIDVVVENQQAEARVAALRAQVDALNMAMAKTASIPAGGSAAGFKQTSAALSAAAAQYNNALAASGQFRVENLKVNDVIETQTDLLRRQKLGYKDIWGSAAARQRMKLIKREQLALRNMTVRSVEGGIGDGHLRANLAIPKEIPKSWDTLRNSVGMFRNELKSASRVLLNWGKNTQWAGRQLTAGLTYPVVAFGAAAGVMAYKVDKELTRVAKVYNTTADINSQSLAQVTAAEKELAQVREAGMDTAMKAAKAYGASVTETIGVQAELAATGQKGMALQGATTEVVKNAMLGEIDYQTATKATIALQQQLHLSTSELGDQWAYLNAMENQTSLTMEDFATAIPIALGPLKQMGGTVQDLGTLLTAMVSRGVQVGKAANAIKATAQRLLRPSKQVADEFRAITGADIKDIAARNGGNVIDIMKELYEVTKGLTDFDKSKAFAGLFGSYQLSTMSAMVEGMGDLSKNMSETESQVVMAQKVGMQGAKDWRKVQDQEIKRFQESVSGKFKIALESIKGSLAEVGQPFLKVATIALKATNSILKFFNALPDGVKTFAAFSAIALAIAGPTIMLVGLFANLAANAGLMVAGSLKLVSSFNLLNKAEWAQTKLDSMVQKGLYSTTDAMAIQTKQLTALTEAVYAHNRAVAMSPGYAGTSAGNALLASTNAGATAVSRNVHQSNVAQIAAQNFDPKSKRYYTTNDNGTRRFEKESVALRRAEVQYAEQIAAAQSMTTRQAYMENQARQKTNQLLTGGKVAMAGMASSMILMTGAAGETGQNIGQWIMMLSLGIPAMKGLAKVASATATSFGASRAAAVANLAAISKTAGPTSKLASLSGRVGASFGAARVAALGLMGPVGWTVAAVGTIGFGVYKWWKHEQEITKEKRKQANAMYDQNALLQDSLKITEKTKAQLSVTGPAGSNAESLPTASALAEEMKKNDTYKTLIDDLKNDDVMQTEKDAIAMTKYRDILEATGGTAEKAQLYLEAMFRAAGQGALEAQTNASNYAREIGQSFTETDLGALWKKQIDSIYNDADSDSIKEQGTNIAKDLANAIAEGGNENADRIIGNFQNLITDKFVGAFDSLPDDISSMLEEAGIKGDAALQRFVVEYNNTTDKIDFLSDKGIGSQMVPALDALIGKTTEWGKTSTLEAGVIEEIGSQLGISADRLKEITTLAELRTTWEWKLASATKDNAKQIAAQRIAQIEAIKVQVGNLSIAAKLSDEDKLRLVNQVRINAGMEALGSIYQANAFLAGRLVDKTEENVSAVKALANAWDTVNFTDSAKDIVQKGMEGVEADLVDAANEQIEARADAAIQAATDAWDKRIDDMDNRHERAMDAFDARWERRKKRVEEAYDAQVDGIDKAIDAEEKAEDLRQKMFEAQMTRIERLKDIANANIDFNVAVRTGDLDEAARIQNDMTAQAQQWALGDAADAGKAASDAKIDALGASKDAIEEAKDKRLDAMAELEDKQKKHLEAMQQAEEDSLKKRSENALQNLKDQWDAEKKNLNDKLDLFQLYTARNKKDLDRWLAEVGLSYDDFGSATMMKGETWSGAIEKSLKEHVRAAGLDIANSQMWEQFGADEAKKTLMGMGFKGWGQFKKFIKTGEISSGMGKRNQQSGINPTEGKPHVINGVEIDHGGGIVGTGGSGRHGVARTHKGLHSSEQMVLAQKGEGILSREAVSKYGTDVVKNMNKGIYEGGPAGTAGLMAAMAMRGLVSGVSKGINTAYLNKKASQATTGVIGSLFGGNAGQYGDRSFNAEQMNNAALIASIAKKLFPAAQATRAAEIGIMTAITESGLVNIHGGDRDSQGLFQQRPSQGWGTVAQVTDPNYAANKFFSVLKGVSGWQNMDPWMAAQSVQRSAFSDGSNYKQYWDEAVAIFTTGLMQAAGGDFTGSGGKHPAADPGKGWSNSHDYRNEEGSPLYAFNDAKVIESRAITGGGTPGNGKFKDPVTGRAYSSYGETIVLQDSAGNKVRYAHLSPGARLVNVGDFVPGGSLIGHSGWTGNASGPHTHFEWNGSEAAQQAFQKYGIGLKSGGVTKKDGMANLHKGETVVDPKRTKKMEQLVDNLATAGNTWTWLAGMSGKIGANGMPIFDMPDVTKAKTNSGATGSGPKVRSGTYNVHFTSSNADTQADLSKLFGMADVLSLTEFTAAKRALIPWMNKQGWGVAGAEGANESVVAYNKGKFAASKAGISNINQTAGRSLSGAIGKGGARKMTAAYALLSGGGTKFWQIAAHTIAHIWKDPELNRKVQQEQFGNLAKLGTRLSGNRKTPVFIGGDLNNDPRSMGGSRPGGRQGSEFFKAFTDAGFTTNWTAEFMKKNSPTMGDRFIDHVMSNSVAKLLNTKSVGGLHSDHKAAISEFQIPQLSKGAQNIKWDNTLANLHKGEAVLTEDLTSQFKQGVANFANGGGNVYNTNVVLNQADMSAEELAMKIEKIQRRKENRRPMQRTNR